MKLNKKLIEELEMQMFEVVCDNNAPVTDDLSVEYMEDPEKVEEAYKDLMEMIKEYLTERYELEQ